MVNELIQREIVGCEVPLMAATLVSFTNVNGTTPDRFPVFSGPHCWKRIIHETGGRHGVTGALFFRGETTVCPGSKENCHSPRLGWGINFLATQNQEKSGI
jgi:hypothetical protein